MLQFEWHDAHLMRSRPCFSNTCFWSTGSRAGSKLSPMSSSRTGLPVRMLFSSVRKKLGSVSFTTRSPFLASIALIHRLAWKSKRGAT